MLWLLSKVALWIGLLAPMKHLTIWILHRRVLHLFCISIFCWHLCWFFLLKFFRSDTTSRGLFGRIRPRPDVVHRRRRTVRRREGEGVRRRRQVLPLQQVRPATGGRLQCRSHLRFQSGQLVTFWIKTDSYRLFERQHWCCSKLLLDLNVDIEKQHCLDNNFFDWGCSATTLIVKCNVEMQHWASETTLKINIELKMHVKINPIQLLFTSIWSLWNSPGSQINGIKIINYSNIPVGIKIPL